MDGFVDFEGVVGGEEGDGGVDGGIVEDFRWDLVQGASCSSWLGN